jgi:hypothetical protein
MNISRHMYAIAGFVLLLTAASLATSRGHAAAAAGTAPVTVMNTAVNPVPITGSVTASVSGTIAATQSGDWNVGQSGTWNVGVPDPVTVQTGTTPLAVTDSSTTSRTPTEIDLSAGFSNGDSMASPLATYTVPSGKRLVLEYVSAFSGIQPGQHLLECDLNNLLFIPFIDGGSDSATEYFSFSQTVKFAFNAGTVISIDATRSGTSNGGLVQVHGFGYLEPM